MVREQAGKAGSIGVALVVCIAMSAIAAPVVPGKKPPLDEADHAFIHVATRSAQTLQAIARLAMQEGDTDAVRNWGTALAADHEWFLAQLAYAVGNDVPLSDAMSAPQRQTLIELAQWRSHWFDRRATAAALAEQIEMLEQVGAYLDMHADRSPTVLGDLTINYLNRLQSHFRTTGLLREAAGDDPPGVMASPRVVDATGLEPAIHWAYDEHSPVRGRSAPRTERGPAAGDP